MLINRLLHFLLAHHDHHLMRCSSSVVNPTVVTALLIMPFYIASDKEYLKKKTHYFRYADSAFPQLYCLKFSFKSVDISKCPARKQKGMFFSETQCRPTLNLPVADIKTEFQKVLVCSPT